MAQKPWTVTSGAPLVGTGFEVLVVGTVGTAFGSIPTGTADAVMLTVEAANVRLRFDGGTPTTTTGLLLGAGTLYRFDRVGPLASFRFIRATGTDGTVNAAFNEVR